MLIDAPPPGRKRRLFNLPGSGEALVCARTIQARGGVGVFIARDLLAAAHLAEEISFFAPEINATLLPDWEVLPYESFSPPAELTSRRLAALYHLYRNAPGILIVAAATALYPLPPAEFLAARAFSLRVGESADRENLLSQLVHGGYRRADRVCEPGEFAVVGGQIDIFPAGSRAPFRVILIGDEIEEIRKFNPDTQRSVSAVSAVETLPAREFPLDSDSAAAANRRLLSQFEMTAAASAISKSIKKGIAPDGAEFLLPLFFDKTANLFDYLPDDAAIFYHAECESAAAEFLRGAKARYDSAMRLEKRPAFPPDELFLSEKQLADSLNRFSRIEISGEKGGGGYASAEKLPDLSIPPSAANPCKNLRAFLESFDGDSVIAVDSEGRRDSIAAMLSAEGIIAHKSDSFQSELKSKSPRVAVASLRGGFIFPKERLAVISEAELFGAAPPPRSRRDIINYSGGISPNELRAGDAVAHRRHGVGFYRGLKTLRAAGADAEFAEIEYGGGDLLLVPVAQLNLLSIYHGGEETKPSKLGGSRWQKTKSRAVRRARDAAAELLAIRAKRALSGGRAVQIDDSAYRAFCRRAGFLETPDQERAINETLSDLKSNSPMDRLICGDVGFGKTEVAMRAAFVAAMGGRQTAVLAPTTLLAEQHHRTFLDRFAGLPIQIARLSRVVSAADSRLALSQIADGKIDIAIGTHRLLSKDVIWRDLGLAIIDEEHRFGVRQKERLLALRGDADILSLTATPIPRTLSMALEGLRDFSVIATPPAARLAIKTFVAPFGKDIIAEAVSRELLRGGQIFFIHNSIGNMDEAAEQLREWLPNARIASAHGRMRGVELESIMRKFLRREIDLLIATTIIESGLHIANANTIIINRADRFGLAQLHQLRGRVGRSHHQAYSYFLIREESERGGGGVNGDAAERLAAIRDMSALGSGFLIAMRDLEIRGAGEVLGEAQSGEIAAVGLEMYQSMLKAAVAAIKKGDAPPLDDPDEFALEVDLGSAALLPMEYCASAAERLHLYRRLAACDSDDSLFLARDEIEDRFGRPPPAAMLLFACHRLRLRAQAIGVVNIKARESAITLEFIPSPPCADALVKAIESGKILPAGKNKVKISDPPSAPFARAVMIESFFDELRESDSA